MCAWVIKVVPVLKHSAVKMDEDKSIAKYHYMLLSSYTDV
jgi:hypothetical protein